MEPWIDRHLKHWSSLEEGREKLCYRLECLGKRETATIIYKIVEDVKESVWNEIKYKVEGNASSRSMPDEEVT